MGWKAAIVSEPAASRGSSTGRTKAGQMAAGTAHARWGSAHRARPKKTSVPPHVCNAQQAVACVSAFVALKVFKLLFFSRFHHVSEEGVVVGVELRGRILQLECLGGGALLAAFSLVICYKEAFCRR